MVAAKATRLRCVAPVALRFVRITVRTLVVVSAGTIADTDVQTTALEHVISSVQESVLVDRE